MPVSNWGCSHAGAVIGQIKSGSTPLPSTARPCSGAACNLLILKSPSNNQSERWLDRNLFVSMFLPRRSAFAKSATYHRRTLSAASAISQSDENRVRPTPFISAPRSISSPCSVFATRPNLITEINTLFGNSACSLSRCSF